MQIHETERLYTVEEFAALPDDGHFYELVDGRIVAVSPVDPGHCFISARIARLLDSFVDDSGLGCVSVEQAGYAISIDPPVVRAPDVAFIRAERLNRRIGAFIEGAPDLVVEVISPSDSAVELSEKIDTYFAAGARLLWVVYPRQRRIVVYQSPLHSEILTEADTLDGGDVLPGFSVPVRKIFAVLDQPASES
ncbi:MAG: Uma2 family endonuclease [Anaerolinea sp.]|nr:Uma2 family endonuclease [Anaerolinea sp.]